MLPRDEAAKVRKRNFTMIFLPPDSPINPDLKIWAIVGLVWLSLDLLEVTLKKIQRIVRQCRKDWTDAA